MFEEESQTPVIVMSELSQNTSMSVMNMAEYLVPEIIQRQFLHLFEAIPPAIFLEQYVEERTPQGRLGRKATWDRLLFASWRSRRVWLSGQERLSFGELQWEHMSASEIEVLIGQAALQALLPQDDQPWAGVPPGF